MEFFVVLLSMKGFHHPLNIGKSCIHALDIAQAGLEAVSNEPREFSHEPQCTSSPTDSCDALKHILARTPKSAFESGFGHHT